jgi:hypothetical protein
MGSPRLVPLLGVADELRPETSCAPEVRYAPTTVAFVNREERFFSSTTSSSR